MTNLKTQKDKSSASTKKYEAAVLPSAESQADSIRDLYAAGEANSLAALRSAFDKNLAEAQQSAAAIPGTYRAAANAAAGDAARERANFQELAAASGLNSGAGSQAKLAQSNALLGNLAAIRKDEANAKTDAANRREALIRDYQNAITQAIAENDLARARALYEEAVRVDESRVDTAREQNDDDLNAWRYRKK